MIGRIFRLLVTVGALSIAVPVWIVLLLFALLAGSGIGLFVFSMLRGLAEGGVEMRGEWPETVPGWIGLALVLLPALSLALVFWAEYCGLSHVFARLGRTSHGSARFSSKRERAALQRGEGLLIGRDPGTNRLLRYDGPAHLITLAPTRAGKGTGTIIPNLLTAARPVLVIDPKGENARITARSRAKFGPVHVLDPFGVTGLPGAAYTFGKVQPSDFCDCLHDQHPALGLR